MHILFGIYHDGGVWPDMYNLFLKRKEDLYPNKRNREGQTAFHSAIVSGGYGQVDHLIGLNADVNAPTSRKDNSTPMALLKAWGQNSETKAIRDLMIEHGATDTEQHDPAETVRPKTRDRKKSREAIATLRKFRESNNHLPADVSEALQTLLQEHDKGSDGSEESSDEGLGVFHDLELPEGRMRRDISTLDFNKEKLKEYAAQFTKQKDGKPHETFDSMPIAGDSKKEHLIIREASPSDLGQRKKRGKTVIELIPTLEEEEDEPIIIVDSVEEPEKPVVINVIVVEPKRSNQLTKE